MELTFSESIFDKMWFEKSTRFMCINLENSPLAGGRRDVFGEGGGRDVWQLNIGYDFIITFILYYSLCAQLQRIYLPADVRWSGGKRACVLGHILVLLGDRFCRQH